MAKDRSKDSRRQYFPPKNFGWDDNEDHDVEPTDRQINSHYYNDSSSFTEGKVTYGKK